MRPRIEQRPRRDAAAALCVKHWRCRGIALANVAWHGQVALAPASWHRGKFCAMAARVPKTVSLRPTHTQINDAALCVHPPALPAGIARPQGPPMRCVLAGQPWQGAACSLGPYRWAVWC